MPSSRPVGQPIPHQQIHPQHQQQHSPWLFPGRTRCLKPLSTASMPACMLLAPHGSQAADLVPLLARAHECDCKRAYVATAGGDSASVDQQLLDWLCQLYGAAGEVNPRMNIIPCLPCAGWTQEQLTTLTDVQLLISHASLQQQAQQLQQLLNRMRAAEAAVRLQACPAADASSQPAADPTAAASPQQQQQQPQSPPPQQQQQQGQQATQPQHRQEQEQLLFSNVAVGGTFDRLHAGHRLLLSATALVSTAKVFVGITADSLLAKKANKQLLQDYDQRRAAAVDFMALVRPGLSVTAGPLSDPLEPTQAELDPAMQALVVSQETLPGGEAINAGRQRRGFAPVRLVVVGLVGGPGAKLSSTALRQAEAAAQGAVATDAS